MKQFFHLQTLVRAMEGLRKLKIFAAFLWKLMTFSFFISSHSLPRSLAYLLSQKSLMCQVIKSFFCPKINLLFYKLSFLIFLLSPTIRRLELNGLPLVSWHGVSLCLTSKRKILILFIFFAHRYRLWWSFNSRWV